LWLEKDKALREALRGKWSFGFAPVRIQRTTGWAKVDMLQLDGWTGPLEQL
jgi:hypothetical protein